MINYLSGTSDQNEAAVGKIKIKRKTKAQRKENRKRIISKIKENIKNPKKLVAKLSLAPSRAAFLVATRVNLLKLAKRLKQGWEKDPSKLTKMWEKFGGDINILKSAISQGSKSKINGGVGYVVTAAAVAAATPIIVAAVKLFSDMKSDKKGDAGEDKSIVETLKDSLADATDVKKEIKDDNGSRAESETPFYKNPFVIGGAALLVAGGIYLSVKKK